MRPDLLRKYILAAAALQLFPSAPTFAQARNTGAGRSIDGSASTDLRDTGRQRTKSFATDGLAVLQAVTGANVCIQYTYDKNGNITVMSSANQTTTPTWGSSAYGCFAWRAP